MIRTCKYLNAHRGAFWVALALAGTTVSPRAAWGQLNWPGYPNNNAISVTSGGNVGIGTPAPDGKLHVEGLTVLHFDDWGNDTLVFRGQKSIANQWGEYAISTSYMGLTFRNTQTGHTLLQLGGGGGTWENSYLNPSGGNVGIGTTNPQYKLAVNGNIGAQDIIVTNTGWSDYVFRPGYRLRPLNEIRQYIQKNGHLPDIPTEAEVKEKGVSLGDMQAKLLAKVEELTLHMIQSDERNDRLERQNQELRERLARLEISGAADSRATAAK